MENAAAAGAKWLTPEILQDIDALLVDFPAVIQCIDQPFCFPNPKSNLGRNRPLSWASHSPAAARESVAKSGSRKAAKQRPSLRGARQQAATS
ncbi:MAG: hypothetical protein Q9P14_03830 [candidate division KSB1 bacterium]|nr:hypothetical protein [candidate division KSB1 bacterium]